MSVRKETPVYCYGSGVFSVVICRKINMDVLSLIPSVLAYDPETGLLIWKVNRGPAKVGDIAGCEFTD